MKLGLKQQNTGFQNLKRVGGSPHQIPVRIQSTGGLVTNTCDCRFYVMHFKFIINDIKTSPLQYIPNITDEKKNNPSISEGITVNCSRRYTRG
jgi:hypothetical protein